MSNPSGIDGKEDSSHNFVVSIGGIGDLETMIDHRCRMQEELHPERKNAIVEDRPAIARWTQEQILAGRYIPFVARDPNGTIAGSAAIWIRDEHPRPGRKGMKLPTLQSVYTEEQFRRMGVATLITREAVKWSREQGFYRIYLHASKIGMAVYEKVGFSHSNEMRIELDR